MNSEEIFILLGLIFLVFFLFSIYFIFKALQFVIQAVNLYKEMIKRLDKIIDILSDRPVSDTTQQNIEGSGGNISLSDDKSFDLTCMKCGTHVDSNDFPDPMQKICPKCGGRVLQ